VGSACSSRGCIGRWVGLFRRRRDVGVEFGYLDEPVDEDQEFEGFEKVCGGDGCLKVFSYFFLIIGTFIYFFLFFYFCVIFYQIGVFCDFL